MRRVQLPPARGPAVRAAVLLALLLGPGAYAAARAGEAAPPAAPAGSRPGRPRFVRAWGKKGAAPGEFNVPIGVAVDSADRVYVTDLRNNRVQRFDADGAFLDAFPAPSPGGIAVAADGRVYVSLFEKDRIGVYSAAGRPLREWGKAGRGDGEFRFPAGLAVGPDGAVYLADDVNRRVQKFSPDGAFLAAWGRAGGGPGEFGGADSVKVPPDLRTAGPSFLAFDRAGLLYATDGRGGKVHRFTADGKFVSAWGSNGTGPGGFGGRPRNLPGPTGVAVDRKGRVWVAATNNRVQLFTPDGAYLVGVGGPGDGPGQFHTPHGVALDRAGHLFVVDMRNSRVQKFAPTP